MTLQQRITAFKSLGIYLQTPDEELRELIKTAQFANGWFTPEETAKAVKGIGSMLNPDDLEAWLPATIAGKIQTNGPKRIGLVLAGNLPLVGFHDILTVLATGNIALIKSSSQDKQLIPNILNKLISIEPEFEKQIQFTERLEGFDAVIATGSNNTSRYFEYYFGKVPNIIRKNRNSIAILRGDETRDELFLLGRDIFDYFGLGCRNVSKLYVPAGYEFIPFFESIEPYHNVGNHHKYCNNYDYNKSIYLINSEKHFDNGFLLVKQDDRIASPLAVIYYEEYDSIEVLEKKIQPLSEQIQVIVSKQKVDVANQQVKFGESQSPRLWDYADGVNTLEFLLSL